MKTTTALLTMALGLAACGAPAPTMQTNSTAASSSSVAAKAPDENAALDTIRKTKEAQATYFKVNRRYALSYEELVEARLMNSEATSAQTGYDFKLRPAADAQTYKLAASPSDAKASSARRFFLDQTGVIRAETGAEATAGSPEVK